MLNKKQETINAYNKSASAISEKFSDIGVRIRDINNAFGFINKTNPKVVEIGCAGGREAKEIIKFTDNYFGIDISEELLKLAKEKVPQAKFQLADIENYIFPKDVDIIFSFASLLHSSKENIKNIFERAHNSLNLGGVFYISLKFGDYHEETKTDEFGTRTYYFYTPELIMELAGNNKYEIIEKDFQDFRDQKWFTIVLRKIS